MPWLLFYFLCIRQATTVSAADLPEGLNCVIQKPTLPLMRIHTDIAEIVTAFMWKQLACNASKGCMLVQGNHTLLQLFKSVCVASDVVAGMLDCIMVSTAFQHDSRVSVNLLRFLWMKQMCGIPCRQKSNLTRHTWRNVCHPVHYGCHLNLVGD